MMRAAVLWLAMVGVAWGQQGADHVMPALPKTLACLHDHCFWDMTERGDPAAWQCDGNNCYLRGATLAPPDPSKTWHLLQRRSDGAVVGDPSLSMTKAECTTAKDRIEWPREACAAPRSECVTQAECFQ